MRGDTFDEFMDSLDAMLVASLNPCIDGLTKAETRLIICARRLLFRCGERLIDPSRFAELVSQGAGLRPECRTWLKKLYDTYAAGTQCTPRSN